MTERVVILIVALASLNLSVIWLARLIVGSVDMKTALSEKAAPAVAPIAGAEPIDAAASSSRLISFVASVVLIGVLWGSGNYLVYAAFFEMDKIPVFLNSISSFFLSGSTLFAPYGINKLTSAVKGQG
jgi:hypothetical protein